MNIKPSTDSSSEISTSHSKLSLRVHWLHGAGLGVLLQGFGLMLSFGSSVFLARVLGAKGLGEFSYVLALVAVLSILAAFGLPTVVIRQLTTSQADGSWDCARGLLRWSNLLVGSIGLMFGLGLILAGYLKAGDQVWLYILAAPLVLVLSWTNMRQRTLQALHHPIAAQLPEQVIKHTIFLAVGIALWITGYHMIEQPIGVMAIWLLAGVASLISGIILLRHFSPPELRAGDRQYNTDVWCTIALPILFAEVLGVIFQNSNTILLGLLRPIEDVGLYQVALRLSGLLLVLLAASNWVLAPWFSKFNVTGEIERIQNVVTKTTRVIFGISILIYIALVFGGKHFLEVFFGATFIKAYPAMLILGAGQLVNVASGPVVNLLAMTGGQRELAWSVAVFVLVNILLCATLVSIFGLIGAAIAVATSNSCYNLSLVWLVRRRIGIRTTIFG